MGGPAARGRSGRPAPGRLGWLESTVDEQAVDEQAVDGRAADGQPAGLVRFESTVEGQAADGQPAGPQAVDVQPVDPYRPLEVTGEMWALLTSVAAAVEHHLPGLLENRPAHSAQVRAIAHEVAAFLLELRSAADLPGGRVGDSDLARVRDAVERWAVGSLADLPHGKPDGTDTIVAPSRWSIASQVLRTVLLGFTPLILLVAMSLLPVTVPTVVTDALGPFAVTWLLISIASAFYPGDRKPDMKMLFGR